MSAPVPYTFTPPGTPRAMAGALPAPPPAPIVDPLSFTPPSPQRRATKTSRDFAATAEKSRKLVKRNAAKGKPAFPAPPAHAPYQSWSSDVRVLLAVSEVVSQLEFSVSLPSATLAHRIGGVAAPVHAILCPDKTIFLSTDENAKGIGGLKKILTKGRAGREDEVTSTDTDLDLLFIAVLGLDERRVPFLHELVRVVIEVVGVSVHWFKDAFAVPRPYQLTHLGDLPAPMLDHPGHASFPGGHAAQAAALGWVLAAVAAPLLASSIGQPQGGLEEVVALVGEARMLAGLHYPVDTDAGIALGTALGQHLVASRGSFAKLNALWALAEDEVKAHVA